MNQFLYNPINGLMLTKGFAVKSHIAKYHWKKIQEAWVKKEKEEISQKEWADILHNIFDEVDIYRGINNVRFARVEFGLINRHLLKEMYPHYKETKAVWVSGYAYDYVHIKLGRSTLKDIELFLSLI